jgi:hypothetical protein
MPKLDKKQEVLLIEEVLIRQLEMTFMTSTISLYNLISNTLLLLVKAKQIQL